MKTHDDPKDKVEGAADANAEETTAGASTDAETNDGTGEPAAKEEATDAETNDGTGESAAKQEAAAGDDDGA